MTKAATLTTTERNPVGELVRKRRKELGFSQPNLARLVGAHVQTLNKIEAGEIKFSKYFYRLETVLGISIVPKAQGNIAQAEVFKHLAANPAAAYRDLPLYGAMQMERTHKLFTNGAFLFIEEPIDMIERPEWLRYNKQAYALKITNDSMAPRFNTGERVIVDPLLEPKASTDVVLRTNNVAGDLKEQPQAGKTHAGTVVHLIEVSKANWLVQQHNHRKGARFSLSRKHWPSCHRIVGATFERT